MNKKFSIHKGCIGNFGKVFRIFLKGKRKGKILFYLTLSKFIIERNCNNNNIISSIAKSNITIAEYFIKMWI